MHIKDEVNMRDSNRCLAGFILLGIVAWALFSISLLQFLYVDTSIKGIEVRTTSNNHTDQSTLNE